MKQPASPFFYTESSIEGALGASLGPTSAGIPIGPVAVGQSAWASTDDTYWGTAPGKPRLPVGIYRMDTHPNLGCTFTLLHNDTDSLVDLPDSESEEILKEITIFKTLRPAFKRHGFLYKRGIFLWGPPGSGKTCTVQQILRLLMREHDSIAVWIDNPHVATACLQKLRQIEPSRQVVAVMEDLDALVDRYDESAFLALLDGESQVDNIVYVACVTPEQRLLTKDLRWVPAGELRQDEELWAFDEHAGLAGVGGRMAARRFRPGRVISSTPAQKECVRVHLEGGESFVCTTDHPWLACDAPSHPYEWIQADQLCPVVRGGKSSGRYVLRAFRPWQTERSWEAGWVAGMLDGEGHVIRGTDGRVNGVGAAQVMGMTLDKMVDLFSKFTQVHLDQPIRAEPHHQFQGRLRMTGGFADTAEFLGRVRPERLIGKFDIAGGIVQGEKARVARVEPVGRQWIQSIQTSTRTYFSEGFAMHNTSNYPEKLDRRFLDRPSRFDTLRYIGMPTPEARRTYLSVKVPELSEIELADYIKHTDKYSIAHLRELIVLTRCFGYTLHAAIDRLNHQRVHRPNSEQSPDRQPVGFFGTND